MLTRTMKRRRFRPMAEINVVPYIDVMLVLLVIFMITAPLLTQGVKVNLPKAKTEVLAQNRPEPIVVSVDASGNYYLNIAANPHQAISPQELQDRVTRELQAAKGLAKPPQILVRGDKQVNYGAVVSAMVLLKQAGAANVGLVTEQPSPINP